MIAVGYVLSFVVVAIFEWTIELDLVAVTVELAKDYGLFPDVLSILGGCAAFAVLSRATVCLLRRRDLSEGFSR